MPRPPRPSPGRLVAWLAGALAALALLWVVSVAAGTAIAGIVSAGFMLAKLLAKTGGA